MRPRYLYTLYCLGLPWKFKIGIAYNVPARMAQIQSELSYREGKTMMVRKALAVPVLFPERTEAWMHRQFGRLRAWVPYHRGHTEWFIIRNYAAALIWLGWLAYAGCTMTMTRVLIAVFLLIVPFPLDGVLLQVVVAIAHFAAGIVGLYIILYALGALLSV